MKYTGADIFLESLKANGVKTIFGYPGGANIPFYDKLNSCKNIKHILVRHEQAAAFAAQGQSRTKKGVGVCLVTSGPGAANALTGVFDAYMDSVPMIFISAQVPYSAMGSDVFQEMDTIGATMSFVKHSFLINDANDIPRIINEAFRLINEGRPGPVHIDLPKDVQNQIFEGNTKVTRFEENKKEKSYDMSEHTISKIIDSLNSSKKPVALIGNGVKLSNAEKLLEKFVDTLGIPTVSTLHAKGVLNETNKNYLGMLGMHGFYHANLATSNADLIINIGSRFDDRIVGTYDSFAKNAKVIHIDVDKAELNKLVKTDIPVCCDARYFLEKIINTNKLKPLNIEEWKKQIDNWNTQKPFIWETEQFSVKNALQNINRNTEGNLGDYIFLTDVGQHQMWAAQIIKVKNTCSWLTSGGSGTMGFALPTAIGVSITNPDKTVVVIAGDGGIQMNIQELQLLKDYNLNIKVIIMNNNFLGMVRQWQDMFYEKNYSSTPISSPNFKALGEAYGLKSYSIDNESDLKKTLETEFKSKKPSVIEVKITKNEENIFPMVAPGTSLENTIVK
ncbi:acetolactate synthase, large subunit, biosynthetic type [Candidatus Gracilibacteria bacterium]|nr:MAG: acetolactate synthase, large subunit, biosynthetic type [Candidatus Gracilibacteria bacterium]PIE85708.1 MAG: acetolactate synthase, large subunit, biosynthetic type [Candidatus Gracilibacteria bacterium]